MSKLELTLAKLYKEISCFLDKNGYPPTVRELCKLMNVKSSSTIFYYLDKLLYQLDIEKGNKVDNY